jgi:hypothetical protein
MPAPDLRAAVLAWIDQHAQVLDDDQKTAWKRHADLLTDAVLEIPLAPGRLDAQLVCVDAPLRLLLREIDGLAKLGVLHLDALDDSEVDDDVVPAGNVTTTDDDTDDDSTP